MRTRYQHLSLNTELTHLTQGDKIKVNFNHLKGAAHTRITSAL